MKQGRPSNAAPREGLVALSVRLPAAIVAEIERRAAELPPSIAGRKSVVTRELLERAILLDKDPK